MSLQFVSVAHLLVTMTIQWEALDFLFIPQMTLFDLQLLQQ